MRSCAVACIFLLAMTSISHGRTFSRFAQSGVSRGMHTYHSFKADCTGKGGVVKVLVKPKHGTIRHFTVTSNPYSLNHPCYRIEMEGTSTPGYRGSDSFKLEVSFPNQPAVVDEFFVDVK
jgi:hypothetical protein